METNSSPHAGGLTAAQLEGLRALKAGIVASAIELCDVRLPNTGFSDSSIHCIFEDLPTMVGYAATIRIRTATPPMEGGRFSYARTDWWDHLLSIPSPRVLLIQDMDAKPGLGAFIGEVHASILQSLGCVGIVTNGAVRDIREVRAAGLQAFAGNVTVSHAYAHVFDFGGQVEIAGLKIRPGDLLHGDLNGVQTVPLGIVDRVLSFAGDISKRRNLLTGLCRSSDFTVDKLREAVKTETLPKTKTR
jgi:4-hydroxy-4-methyl-2-oxoglutarate aldolase